MHKTFAYEGNDYGFKSHQGRLQFFSLISRIIVRKSYVNLFSYNNTSQIVLF